MANETHRADARHFLDERGSTGSLAPNGLNPATILERAVVNRIINNTYFYKEQCFAINEADIVSRCVQHVHFIGGTFGDAQKASPFLCLAFKLLQLAPGDDVLQEYLGYGGEKFKYLRALACFYVRLTRPAQKVYEMLEPFLADGRKLRRRNRTGTALTYMDVFVDDLLTKERVCGTSLWKMPKREVLEDLDVLEPRVSPLGDIDELLDAEDLLEVGDSPREEFGDDEGVESDGERDGGSGDERLGKEEDGLRDVDMGLDEKGDEDGTNSPKNY